MNVGQRKDRHFLGGYEELHIYSAKPGGRRWAKRAKSHENQMRNSDPSAAAFWGWSNSLLSKKDQKLLCWKTICAHSLFSVDKQERKRCALTKSRS